MAVRDINCECVRDVRKSDGFTIRRVAVYEHEEFSAGEWAAVRSAAATSLAALDTWYANCGDSGRASWWANKPQVYREDIRQAILGLA